MAEIIPFTPITPYTIQFAEEPPQPLSEVSLITIKRARTIAEIHLGRHLPNNPATHFPDFKIFNTSNEVLADGLGCLL